MQSFQIGNNEKGQRFDKYLKKLLSEAPGSFIYKMLRKKNITLNGKKADGSEKLNLGDEVKLFLSEETFAKFASPLLKVSQNTIPDSSQKQNLKQKQQIPEQQSQKSQENITKKYPCIPLDIIYEDEDILVINKPVGMLSQKAAPTDISANEYIIGYLLKQQSMTEKDLATFRPSVCNRLDRNTSGLLIAGKSLKGLQDMAKQLNDRSIEKYYRCLVKGEISRQQLIEGWLWKDEKNNQVKIYEREVPNSKYIKTGYAPIRCFCIKHSEQNEKNTMQRTPLNRKIDRKDGTDSEIYTLLEVHLITGRSHQIRAHLASIGHPIVGDNKYGDKKVNLRFSRKLHINSQLLHAYRMNFADGRELTAPLGQEFQRAAAYLKKNSL